MREFAAQEIAAGRLPLWNPYLMSGTTLIGNFQSALFYPPNAIYLLLPSWRAVNVDYALHFTLMAVFMFAWARTRGISTRGALLAALVGSLGAPVYLRMLGGQLTMVNAMAWAPLLFLAVDKIFDRASARRPVLGFVLLGAAAVGMQILAGHPQTVFITGFATAAYCGLRFPGAERRLVATVSLLILGGWGVALSAIQLLPGLETASESLRSGGTEVLEFSTTFSFPPENLLNLVAPTFFGDRIRLLHWGRWGFWDATAFIGVVGVTLAVYGARFCDRRQRRFAPFLIVLLTFIAMGRYSPIYELATVVPVLSSLRGPSKFLFVATMFAGILCGAGFDRLRPDSQTGRLKRSAAVVWAICAALLIGIGAIALASRMDYGRPWRDAVFRHMSDGLFATAFFSQPPEYFERTATWAMLSLAAGAALLAVAGVLLWKAHHSWARNTLWAICCAEVIAFGAAYAAVFDPAILEDPQHDSFYTSMEGDGRVLHIAGEQRVYDRNAAMRHRRPAVWGYEPVMLQRYGMLVSAASTSTLQHIPSALDRARWGSDIVQHALNLGHIELGEDPDTRTAQLSNAFDIARTRYIVIPGDMLHTQRGFYENPEALPRFLLLNDYRVLTAPMDIIRAVLDEDFQPRREVILEEEPSPAPAPDRAVTDSSIVVEDESSDHLTLSVSLDQASILFMTDPISSGWRVTALEGSAQEAYDLLPADFAFRAIPLSPGTHHMRLEYLPGSFLLGLRITLVALIAFAAAAVYWLILASGAYLAKNAR